MFSSAHRFVQVTTKIQIKNIPITPWSPLTSLCRQSFPPPSPLGNSSSILIIRYERKSERKQSKEVKFRRQVQYRSLQVSLVLCASTSTSVIQVDRIRYHAALGRESGISNTMYFCNNFLDLKGKTYWKIIFHCKWWSLKCI